MIEILDQRLEQVASGSNFKGKVATGSAPISTPIFKPQAVSKTATEEDPDRLYGNFELAGSGGDQNLQIKLPAAKFAQHRGRLILGSSAEEAHITVKNASVGPKHVEILCRNGRMFVKDLNYRTGTAINGKPLAPHVESPINMGESLTLGKVKFTVRKVAMPKSR